MTKEEIQIANALNDLKGKTILGIANLEFRLFDPDIKKFRILFTDGTYLDISAEMIDYDVCALILGGAVNV